MEIGYELKMGGVPSLMLLIWMLVLLLLARHFGNCFIWYQAIKDITNI